MDNEPTYFPALLCALVAVLALSGFIYLIPPSYPSQAELASLLLLAGVVVVFAISALAYFLRWSAYTHIVDLREEQEALALCLR